MFKLTRVAAVFILCAATGLVLAQAEDPKQPAAGQEQVEEQERAEEQEKAEEAEHERPVPDAEKRGAVEPGGDDDNALEPENRLVQAQLDRALPELTFDGVGFSDVIDFLRDVSNANIFVNWRALEAAGIDRNATVNVRLRQVKFGKALQIILDGVGGADVKLDYEIDDGVITISTADDLGRNTHTRAYDVREIIRPKAGGPEADQATRLATLTKLITGSVAPHTWQGRGGTAGAIRELQDQLVITQTPEGHDAIANLLNQTRSLLGLKPMEDPAPVVSGPKE